MIVLAWFTYLSLMAYGVYKTVRIAQPHIKEVVDAYERILDEGPD